MNLPVLQPSVVSLLVFLPQVERSNEEVDKRLTARLVASQPLTPRIVVEHLPVSVSSLLVELTEVKVFPPSHWGRFVFVQLTESLDLGKLSTVRMVS